MYRAKTAGRNRTAFFELTMQAEIEERLAIERDLALAIEAGQLEMYLQPQVDRHGTAISAELLMRWTHPQRGAISPAIFIPVAEESGIILQLGNWTLHQGCNVLMQLAAAGHAMPLSINVSPHQFRQADFVDQVRVALAKSGADPRQLILEITEGLLIENLEDTIGRMLEIARLGIRFSIDDFGTGYSSLSYLKRLPLFELKIDKSFIKETPDDPDDTAIVQSILSMAKHLRLRVVAEGVETQQQADFLISAGCDALQGYLFARPMPIAAWLQKQSTSTTAN
jgi:EAL domain-containing protein (putative c-di-GMP-specific phosphodiesterase class I)